jgi:hypothetical protein
MPNPMTVDRVVGGATGGAQQGTKFAPAITLVTTGIQTVKDQTGGVATAYLMPQSAPSATGPWDVFKFVVRATFKVTTGGTSTNVVSIYLGNPATAVSGNILATITSQSLVTLSAAGFLELHGIWDSTSTIVSGVQLGVYGTTAVSGTIVTNTGLTAANLAALKFSVASNNASSVTGTVFQLGEFTAELV